jgi:hypothetical protein
MQTVSVVWRSLIVLLVLSFGRLPTAVAIVDVGILRRGADPIDLTLASIPFLLVV